MPREPAVKPNLLPTLERPDEPPLVAAQQAAAARLGDVLGRGGVAVLCGPAGSGKTMLLQRLSRQQAAGGSRRCGCVTLRELAEGAPGPQPSLLLVDDAHAADSASELSRIVEGVFCNAEPAAVVLAGEGRLLTLLARQPDLEQRVRLRAVLPPWRESETASLAAACLPELIHHPDWKQLAGRLHELAAGIPRQAVRLIETVRMVLSAEPGHRLKVDDLETFHRRLSLLAA
jgi:type II secretory pathway predicted ATPase ExeA